MPDPVPAEAVAKPLLYPTLLLKTTRWSLPFGGSLIIQWPSPIPPSEIDDAVAVMELVIKQMRRDAIPAEPAAKEGG